MPNLLWNHVPWCFMERWLKWRWRHLDESNCKEMSQWKMFGHASMRELLDE